MRGIRLFFSLSLFLLISVSVCSQNFDDYFSDATLRLDYVFCGNSGHQSIYLDKLVKDSRWAGRRHRLSELPLAGNGQINVRDKESGAIIYRHSFSSLFQEWCTTEEATKVSKSFENTFLIPFPKSPVIVDVTLFDTHAKAVASLSHEVRPDDILIHSLNGPSVAFKEIYHSDDISKAIDVAFVAEGYKENEMDIFLEDCKASMNKILSSEAFSARKDKFNFYAVMSPSKDTGVSIPHDNLWKNTAVGSHFDTFYSDRYLTCLNIHKLHDILSGIPYEHIIILANTEQYGGGGIYNSYLLSAAHNEHTLPVVVHEFGHSFGGLADEYFYDDEYEPQYPADREPWEPNITTLVDFGSKWKDMVPDGTPVPTPPSGKDIYTGIGVYEGAGYSSKGVYRPVQECRMKINEAPDFCPVCKRAIVRLIDFYTKF